MLRTNLINWCVLGSVDRNSSFLQFNFSSVNLSFEEMTKSIPCRKAALRAHLHLATATATNQLLLWCCIVTPSDCDVAAMSLGNRFVSHSGAMSQRHRRRVAVARYRCDPKDLMTR